MIGIVVAAVKSAWAFVLPWVGPALEWALPAWMMVPGAGSAKRALRVASYVAVLGAGIYGGVTAHAYFTGGRITEQQAVAKCNGLISSAEVAARERAVAEREQRVAERQANVASDTEANEAFRKELDNERAKLRDGGGVFADDDGLRNWRRRGY